jgi:hypothetical protein
MIRIGAAVFLVLAVSTFSRAYADTINFDEFASPPVTGLYVDTGVVGPLVYPYVTITDGANQGSVMNNTGWSDLQTSGNNLFGTLSGSMLLTFDTSINNLALDLINGLNVAHTFTLSAFDLSDSLLSSQTPFLDAFDAPGSVGHVAFNLSDIRKLTITGNRDFAIDTISFDDWEEYAVPEPATLVLSAAPLAALGLLLLRRKARRPVV